MRVEVKSIFKGGDWLKGRTYSRVFGPVDVRWREIPRYYLNGVYIL